MAINIAWLYLPFPDMNKKAVRYETGAVPPYFMGYGEVTNRRY